MRIFRRRNRDSTATDREPLRSSLANAAWAVEDRVVLGASDFFHNTVEVVRWPFERALWAVENWVVWPFQEETADWSAAARAGLLAILILPAAAIGVVAGVSASDPSGATRTPTIAVVPLTKPEPPARVESSQPTGPVLHGAQPRFSQESGGGIPPSARPDAAAQADANRGVAAVSPDDAATAKGGGEVAGPEAIEVARRFAGAFVLYETGRTDDRVREAFAETASPELRQALLKRPPRLPAGAEVPKAKVLNIVSGPKLDDAYNLSVSLLRVGVTSELKLRMEKLPGSTQGTGTSTKLRWLVTDVRG